VEEGPGGRAEGGERGGHENGCTLWGKWNCSGPPIQLVIPLEVDQGREVWRIHEFISDQGSMYLSLYLYL